jgi:hypothetical protein
MQDLSANWRPGNEGDEYSEEEPLRRVQNAFGHNLVLRGLLNGVDDDDFRRCLGRDKLQPELLLNHGSILNSMLQDLIDRGFECQFVSHAGAILDRDFPSAVTDISTVLAAFDVPITEIVGSGGGETKGTQRMRFNALTS